MAVRPRAARASDDAPDERAEKRAVAAIEKARKVMERDDARKTWDALLALRDDHGSTKAYGVAREELDLARTAAGLDVIGVAAGFAARVEAKKERLTLTYDLTDPAARRDFEPVHHLPDKDLLRRSGDEIFDTGAWCHVATFKGEPRIEVEGVILADHDFGLIFIDPDAEKSRFLLGALNNQFFGVMYGRGRSITRGHLTLIAGDGADSEDTLYPTQLFSETTKPTLTAGQTVRMALEYRGDSIRLRVLPTSLTLDGSFTSKAQRFTRFRVGIHLHRSRFKPQRIVIEGELDERWAKQAEAELREEIAEEMSVRKQR